MSRAELTPYPALVAVYLVSYEVVVKHIKRCHKFGGKHSKTVLFSRSVKHNNKYRKIHLKYINHDEHRRQFLIAQYTLN
jgi:hypothetical protein